MKTNILQLEPHDDIISTRDKMGWGKDGRILLVWPQRGAPLTRRLDLALLQRHSQSLGAQLALVSRDPDVRWNAGQLGIPVFKSLRKAQNARWRASRRAERFWEAPESPTPRPAREVLLQRPIPAPLPLSPLRRLLFFTLGVLALLAIAAVLLPEARVGLVPESRLQEITFTVQADPAIEKTNLSGRVPARPVRVIVEGREQIPASGTVQTPDWPAAGSLTFTNLTDQTVSIPEGTVVRTLGNGPIRFAVGRAGVVLAGPGETVSLPVRALAPGADGNLPAGSLTAIESMLGTQVTATNPEPTRGGKDRIDPAPNGTDRKLLSERLHASLRQSALNELKAGLEPGDVLLTSSLALERTLESIYIPEQGAPGDELELSLRIEYRAQVVSHEDLRSLAYAVLDANLPYGFHPLPTTLHVEIEPETGGSGDGPTGDSWELHASRQIQAQVAEDQAVRLALGLPPDQAGQRLAAGLPLQGPPQIALLPAWWPRLPFVPFRIHILLNGGEPQG